MGKHERQSIEDAEKIIVKILNSQKIGESNKRSHWFNHAVAITEKIKRDFPNITSARHLGNRYDNTGDILIISKKNKFFIETKMSDTKAGIGTKANISQDALTENHLFMGKVKSWSRFRQEKNHDKWVNDLLNQFTNYPQSIRRIPNPIAQKEEKARYLRNLKAKGNKKVESVLKNIHERDKKEKIEYLTYLNKQTQRKEFIKRFFILITLGIHRKEELENLMKKDNFFQEIQNLLVYYGNAHKGRIIARREDVGERIQKILKKYTDFRIIFPERLTHCKIIGIKGEAFKPLLQIVFHWKNIAQGIKTSCLNIFDLTAKFD